MSVTIRSNNSFKQDVYMTLMNIEDNKLYNLAKLLIEVNHHSIKDYAIYTEDEKKLINILVHLDLAGQHDFFVYLENRILVNIDDANKKSKIEAKYSFLIDEMLLLQRRYILVRTLKIDDDVYNILVSKIIDSKLTNKLFTSLILSSDATDIVLKTSNESINYIVKTFLNYSDEDKLDYLYYIFKCFESKISPSNKADIKTCEIMTQEAMMIIMKRIIEKRINSCEDVEDKYNLILRLYNGVK